ncbi:MAG: hypothetical protein ACOCWM_04830 [Cyclobacteriaceae bacterium]
MKATLNTSNNYRIEFTDPFKDKLVVKKINCDKIPSLCEYDFIGNEITFPLEEKEYMIRGFPKIALQSNGFTCIIEYELV